MTQGLTIHLVHGTWPHGPLRRRRSNQQDWFAVGSPFRKALGEAIPENSIQKSFEWSGRNGFAERSKAAVAFAHYLEGEVVRSDALHKHVIVAHSHGGTVSVNALGFVDESISRRISALICISTPFAYWVPAGVWRHRVFCTAVGSMIAALLMVCILKFDEAIFHTRSFVVLIASVVSTFAISVSLSGLTSRFKPVDYPQEFRVPEHVRVALLRAPSDEASLAIGFTQALQAVTRYIFETVGIGPDVRSKFSILGAAVLFPFALVPGYSLVQSVAPKVANLDSWSYAPTFVLATGIVAFLYFFCFFCQAIALGYFRIGLWPHREVEVEVAPPGIECTLRVMQIATSEEGSALRHGAHRLDEVRVEVGAIIRRILE